MAVTGTTTVRDMVLDAYRKVGIVADDEAASASEMASGIRALNYMLKAWQNKQWLTWTYTSGSVALTANANHTLSPARPIRILNARFSRGGIETPMERMTRDEYDALPIKANTGTPTVFYFDRQKEASTLYVWPVLAAAAGETVEYTYEREIEDLTDENDILDVPMEWQEACLYNLAARLAENNMAQSPDIDAKAFASLQDVLSEDTEGSVFFYGEG